MTQMDDLNVSVSPPRALTVFELEVALPVFRSAARIASSFSCICVLPETPKCRQSHLSS